jgi:hypothetical protein
MRHAGRSHGSFKPLPIGEWAKWTYSETRSGPVRRPYVPFDLLQRHAPGESISR